MPTRTRARDMTRSNRRGPARRPLAYLLATGVMLASCSTGGDEPAPTPTTPDEVAVKAARPSTIFGAGNNNPYTVDITHVSVDPNSAHYMNDIRGQMAANDGVVPINTEHYNSSFVVADPETPRVTLEFDNCQNKPDIPPGMYDGPAHFVDVPIPAASVPARGTDGALAIWSPDADKVWEFWKVSQTERGWSACWGGRIDDVSASNGTFPHPWGTSASGLVTIGSMISLEEAEAGRIDHAMSIGLTTIAREPIVVPANRTDGKSEEPSAPPMGTRLRLDASVDVDSLDLTPLGKAVARAAQTYGFIVSETAHTVSVGAESGLDVEAATGQDPWAPILGDVPWYSQLENFPWDDVAVVRLGYAPPGVTGGVVPPPGSESTPAPGTPAEPAPTASE